MGQAEWVIGLVTSFVIVIAVLKSRANMVFRFLVQGAVGAVMIYGVNEILRLQSIPSIIALNPLTFLTVGSLGFPGVVLLFLIQFLNMI